MSDAAQHQITGFGIANYRSFDATGFLLEGIRKINVFIGKNNSGKSNILRALRLLRRIDNAQMLQGKDSGHRKGLCLVPEIDFHERNGIAPSISLTVPFRAAVDQAGRSFYEYPGRPASITIRWNTASGNVESCTCLDTLNDHQLIDLHSHVTRSQFTHDVSRKLVCDELATALLQRILPYIREFENLICVENFREIRQLGDTQSADETFNGYNVIARLREMQHPRIGREKERSVFDRIETFVGDLVGEGELRLEIPTSDDSIYVSMHEKRLPLQSYGTGIHQLVILCSALAMHDNYVVCIEEPEIHMHPELQRKFLSFIASDTTNKYFITTHSNVFLDFLPHVALYHIVHNGTSSAITHIDAPEGARTMLTDLGYKASDLLQANCLIWVEGPSDRVYINKWLHLLDPGLVEYIHYAIAFYGGRVLAHFSAADDPGDNLVQVLRINRHAVFVMDRDDVKPNGRLTDAKERIIKELGPDQCWVTEGREIENYLRPMLLKQYLRQKCGCEVNVSFGRNKRMSEAIAKATSGKDGPVVHYDKAKVIHARQICAQMTDDDLDTLDLRDRISNLVSFIHRWNGNAGA